MVIAMEAIIRDPCWQERSLLSSACLCFCLCRILWLRSFCLFGIILYQEDIFFLETDDYVLSVSFSICWENK